ncbi:C2 and GRAM domain-containing protein [Phytophthora citrophthora]|uniref:C2 and GRAM domain-containing protein n=1 Tax=Phytophthora citrophthora TaxID=4793 RepID=A0AAD9LR60_9STRA|nr:C2 and GRAM domain-containing protein [Phytophthora citrophthora]
MERYLKVRIYGARDLRGFHSYSRPHPFCKISVSGEKFKTSSSDHGHTPHWDEEFVFHEVDPQDDEIVIKVKDKSSSHKKFIGECRLPVSLFVNGNPVDNWYPLNDDSEPVGEIYLRVHLKDRYEQPVTVVAPVVVAPTYQQQPQGYGYQQPPPAYGYPPQPQGYPSQPPPPQGYGYQQPPPVAYAAGPPVMVVEERRDCSPRGYDRGSPRRYNDGYGREEPRQFSGAQVAMGVGAGVLGGVVLGEMADRVFGDNDSD